MDFQLLPDWHVFLPRAGGHVVSLMGSGGKTALMRAIAGQYVAESVAVLLTTTTRSEVLDWVPDLNLEELAGENSGQLREISFFDYMDHAEEFKL